MKNKKNLIFASSPDSEQMLVILNPKDSFYSFDCIRIKLTDMNGDIKQVDMTPDEALELSSLLSHAVKFFLITNKEYEKFIKKEKKTTAKKCGYKLVEETKKKK